MLALIFVSLLCGIELEVLYDQATTRLVNYVPLKDSAVSFFVTLGCDSSTSDTVLAFLISKFDTKSSVERHTLKTILSEIGEIAIKEIVAHIDFRGSDSEARALKQSLWVLGEIGGQGIVDPAAEFVSDSEWAVRSGAYTALGKSGSPLAIPYICRGLNDTVAPVRKSAYHALAEIASEREVEYLAQGLSDSFYGVRYAALSGLLRIGCGLTCLIKSDLCDLDDYFSLSLRTTNDTIPELDDLIHSKPPAVRKAAYVTFSKQEMLTALREETHPLLRNFLQKRIAAADTTEQCE